MANPIVQLARGHDKRFRAGHPWIYNNELKSGQKLTQYEAGTLVSIALPDGQIAGVGHLNPHSLMAVRVLSRNRRTLIDQEFYRRRIARALELREWTFSQPYYRLINSEGDGLSGLTIERFGSTLCIAASTAGMVRDLEMITAAVDEVIMPSAIYVRNDSKSLGKEGLEPHAEWVKGQEAETEVMEGDRKFLISLSTGQKTGWYFDQRTNREWLGQLAKGRRMLDVYCYAGGFALAAAAHGAESVLAIDSSASALEVLDRAAALNDMTDRVATRKSDAQAALHALADEKASFDIVNLDPPSFAPSARDKRPALNAFRKLAAKAAPLVAEQGLLTLSSCSGHVTTDDLIGAIRAGLKQAGRRGMVLHVAGAAPDHPSHPAIPETRYLNFVAFALD